MKSQRSQPKMEKRMKKFPQSKVKRRMIRNSRKMTKMTTMKKKMMSMKP